MPEMDGLQLLQQLQAAAPPPEVVMISGHGNIETAVKATKLGAFDFIEKPFSLDGLLRVVKRALDHHAAVLRRSGAAPVPNGAGRRGDARRRHRTAHATAAAHAAMERAHHRPQRRRQRPGAAQRRQDRTDPAAAAAGQRHSVHQSIDRRHRAGAAGVRRFDRLRHHPAPQRHDGAHRRAPDGHLARLPHHQPAGEDAGRGADHGRLGHRVLPT